MKQSIGTPKTRYRSVHYRLSKDFSNSINRVQSCHYTSAKTTKYAPQKVSQFMSKTTNSIPSISNKKVHEVVQNAEDESSKKRTYIDTWKYLLKLEKKEEKKPIREARVALPVVTENDSYFTVLDNINLPIQYIKNEIVKVEAGVKKEQTEIEKIRKGFQEIEEKYTKIIEETQKMGVKGISKLKSLLKADKIREQEARLKIRSSFQTTRTYLPNYRTSFEKEKKRVQTLQEAIFSNKPFELKQGEEYVALSSDYF